METGRAEEVKGERDEGRRKVKNGIGEEDEKGKRETERETEETRKEGRAEKVTNKNK